MSEPVLILTMKWGTLYSADDVNRLARQVRRNLARPHRFICFTDDAVGFEPGIEAFPLPELGLPPGNGDTRWRKLALFQPDLFGLQGMALFLDLDLVVVRDLSPFFELPGTFIGIRDDDLFRPKPLRKLRPTRDRFLHMVANTSVFRFTVGGFGSILQGYLAAPGEIAAQYEHEQQFVSAELDRKGQLSYWPKGWCVSFKNDCVPRHLLSYVSDPSLPETARIVVFAGSPKMDDVFSGKGGKWYRRIGKIDWLEQAWQGKSE
ncbi:hypothetical protein [Paracoccus aminophilus]|uniref:Glycosyltransferase n=1 Tax=Paracoccus aminophilus JCM 7686 TaxID=1367847 RepID=S5YWE3_PARAH|nr:hypothetical protein [Paracoccus aminophilus]AGT09536.1 hypothetical protein JCM7686_2468 [Paracoccus aminophilus JCM 7686]